MEVLLADLNFLSIVKGVETFLILKVFAAGMFYISKVELNKLLGWENLTLGVRLCNVLTKLEAKGLTMGLFS